MRWHPPTTVALVALSLAACGGSHATPSPRTPALGLAKFQSAPDARGFGQAHPAEIFNGGDPSGHVVHVAWLGWGSSVAMGTGMTSIYMSQGGYYPDLVQASLRADHLGTCDGVPAYIQLSIRVPDKPGGTLGPWTLWSDATDLCAAQ